MLYRLARPHGSTHFGNGIRNRNRLPGFNLLPAVREDLQQRERLLGLLISMYIHQDGAGFAILRDHDRLAVLA